MVNKSICMIEGETDLDKGRDGLALDPVEKKQILQKPLYFSPQAEDYIV